MNPAQRCKLNVADGNIIKSKLRAVPVANIRDVKMWVVLVCEMRNTRVFNVGQSRCEVYCAFTCFFIESRDAMPLANVFIHLRIAHALICVLQISLDCVL